MWGGRKTSKKSVKEILLGDVDTFYKKKRKMNTEVIFYSSVSVNQIRSGVRFNYTLVLVRYREDNVTHNSMPSLTLNCHPRLQHKNNKQ